MRALFRTTQGLFADLHKLEQDDLTEAATMKQGLMTAAQEASMVRIRILKRVSMGWCTAMAGEERDVTEAQLAILEAELPGRTERVDMTPPAPKMEKDEGLADDVPGAPPMGQDKKLGKTKGKRRRRRREED